MNPNENGPFKPPRRGGSSVHLVPPTQHLVPRLTGGLLSLYHNIRRLDLTPPTDYKQYTDAEGCFNPKVVRGRLLLASRYEYTEVIGRGQSSVLLKAKDTFQDNRSVALKVLHTNYSMLGSQEAGCLRSLNAADPDGFSPLLRLHNTFMFGLHFCLVFELLHPESLVCLFQKQSKEERLKCVRKVAVRLISAVGFLQTQNVIHADLKPDNLLLTQQKKLRSLKVVDFGNAIHCIHNEMSLYYEDFEFQTLLYRAPEVIFGLMFGPEVDMWSVGCILAELYLGQPLFYGQTLELVVFKMHKLLGPLPQDVFQRGKFFDRLSRFTQRGPPFVGVTDVMRQLDSSDFAFVDFLIRLLRFDPASRMTVREAALHPFLAAESGARYIRPISSPSYNENSVYPKILLTPETYLYRLKRSECNGNRSHSQTPLPSPLESASYPGVLRFQSWSIKAENSPTDKATARSRVSITTSAETVIDLTCDAEVAGQGTTLRLSADVRRGTETADVNPVCGRRILGTSNRGQAIPSSSESLPTVDHSIKAEIEPPSPECHLVMAGSTETKKRTNTSVKGIQEIDKGQLVWKLKTSERATADRVPSKYLAESHIRQNSLELAAQTEDAVPSKAPRQNGSQLMAFLTQNKSTDKTDPTEKFSESGQRVGLIAVSSEVPENVLCAAEEHDPSHGCRQQGQALASRTKGRKRNKNDRTWNKEGRRQTISETSGIGEIVTVDNRNNTVLGNDTTTKKSFLIGKEKSYDNAILAETPTREVQQKTSSKFSGINKIWRMLSQKKSELPSSICDRKEQQVGATQAKSNRCSIEDSLMDSADYENSERTWDTEAGPVKSNRRSGRVKKASRTLLFNGTFTIEDPTGDPLNRAWEGQTQFFNPPTSRDDRPLNEARQSMKTTDLFTFKTKDCSRDRTSAEIPSTAKNNSSYLVSVPTNPSPAVCVTSENHRECDQRREFQTLAETHMEIHGPPTKRQCCQHDRNARIERSCSNAPIKLPDLVEIKLLKGPIQKSHPLDEFDKQAVVVEPISSLKTSRLNKTFVCVDDEETMRNHKLNLSPGGSGVCHAYDKISCSKHKNVGVCGRQTTSSFQSPDPNADGDSCVSEGLDNGLSLLNEQRRSQTFSQKWALDAALTESINTDEDDEVITLTP